MSYEQQITIQNIPGYNLTIPILCELAKEDGRYYASVLEISLFLKGEGTTPESAQRNLEKSIAAEIKKLEEEDTRGSLSPRGKTLLTKFEHHIQQVKTK